jgi:hypothetical protein
VEYILLPVIVIVVLTLLWSWWGGRSERDPASSVDHFHRALVAMRPGEEPRGAAEQRTPAPEPEAPAADDAAERANGA